MNSFINDDEVLNSTNACCNQWAKHIKYKEILMLAGPSFVSFTSIEIKKFFGLFILHGLSPSPRIEHKFKPRSMDPVNSNDFAFHTFSRNAERRLRDFKRYFAVADPTVAPPNKKACLNWKAQEMILHANLTSQFAWIQGPCGSVDE